jgi:hypothetical protein
VRLPADNRPSDAPHLVRARRDACRADDAALIAERQVPGGMRRHEVEHPSGQLVVVNPCVPRPFDFAQGADGPRRALVHEQLVLCAGLTRHPVVDGRRGDRRGKRAEVLPRRAGDGGEHATGTSIIRRRLLESEPPEPALPSTRRGVRGHERAELHRLLRHSSVGGLSSQLLARDRVEVEGPHRAGATGVEVEDRPVE